MQALSSHGYSQETERIEIAPAETQGTESAPNLLRKEQLMREAALGILCDASSNRRWQLQNLSEKEWWRLVRWLDISGLALYFPNRVLELELCEMLPSDILARLQQNLLDNSKRTRGMIAESVSIQQEFQKAGLSYAVLKGFSLWPCSVLKPELRSQFDLDFLIDEKSLPEARQILERKGYCLFDFSGRSWSFKTTTEPGVFLKDLYKDLPFGSAELHVEGDFPGRRSLLNWIEKRDFYGILMPVLSPVDLFLGHGLHVYHHVCGEFSRASRLLELRRHVLSHRDDDAFWQELRSVAEENPRASAGLGVVTLLITRAMGDFAPAALTSWTVERLPRSVRLWVEIYGCRGVFNSLPGSKLYMLLEKELGSSDGPAKRPLRRIFLPTRISPEFTWAAADETLAMRIRRHRRQLNFIFFRLRFHIVEGLRYAWESYRWRKCVNRRT